MAKKKRVVPDTYASLGYRSKEEHEEARLKRLAKEGRPQNHPCACGRDANVLGHDGKWRCWICWTLYCQERSKANAASDS